MVGEHFIEDDAEGEDVAAAIESMRFAEGLFGAHVGWGTGDGALFELLIGADCEAEVSDEGELRGGLDEDVGGFDVAMDDVLLVCRFEGSGDPGEQQNGVAFGNAAVAEECFEGGAIDEAGDSVYGAFGGCADIVDGDDPGVGECGGHAGFGEVDIDVCR